VSLARRLVVPERLDDLPPEAPVATASRRDLCWINRISAQPAIAARALRRHLGHRPRRILEVGAGDGSTSLLLARRLSSRWPGVTMVLLDRQEVVTPVVRRGFDAVGWRAEPAVADVFDWLGGRTGEPFDAVIANLFLHHFQERLPELLVGVARLAPVFVATEPRRDALTLGSSMMVALIGATAVTRHDAPASVRAGFSGRELTALWPAQGWQTEERRAGLFTHLFVARHNA
jgi:protein-L-isoaspartate O-methyltransferase